MPNVETISSIGGHGSMFEGQHVYVFDCETLHSSEDCRVCLTPWEQHNPQTAACPPGSWHAQHSTLMQTYHKLGWEAKGALGLSIGCAFSYREQRMVFFDEHTLEATMRQWVDEQALLVGFNILAFDLPLLRAILRRRAQVLWEQTPDARTDVEAHKTATAIMALCDAFKLLCATSYDILAECWTADPLKKRVKGLHTLDSLAQANGYGGKTGTGAQAPRLWAAGRHEEVKAYCQNDVYLTKSLFEMIMRGEGIKRSDGSILYLPKPDLS